MTRHFANVFKAIRLFHLNTSANKLSKCKHIQPCGRHFTHSELTDFNKLLTSSIYPSNAQATYIQSTRTQRFLTTSKPCHVGIHTKALTDYSQMRTNAPGFQFIFKVFCIILYWPN